MIKWIRTSRLSIKKSLSQEVRRVAERARCDHVVVALQVQENPKPQSMSLKYEPILHPEPYNLQP